MRDRKLYSGLIRMHALHHASKHSVFGLGLMEELAQHGYRLSAGTTYPILHALESKGYLRMTLQRKDGQMRKQYRATPEGRRDLASAKAMIKELFGALFEEADGQRRARRKTYR